MSDANSHGLRPPPKLSIYTIGQWAVIAAVALTIGGFLYFDRTLGPKPMTCLGGHNVYRLDVVKDSSLVMLPQLGEDAHVATISGNCTDIALDPKAFEVKGVSQVCVGDDLQKLGASQSGCNITSMATVRSSEVNNLLSQR